MLKAKNMLNSILYKLDSLICKFILTLLSCPNAIKSWMHAEKVLAKNLYNGENILLIALYQKGVLRDDIKNLLLLAKKQGLYVIGVNTQKLVDAKSISPWFDTYIERFNFGRDFGSYKTGFKYIFDNLYHLHCPRVIMLNDSVFYESTRTGKFLDSLMNTQIEALGATENYEIEHHLGSFCISIAGRVVRHPKFMRYWRCYRNSDIRPSVIKRGEMALSLCLKRLVVSPEHFQALYNTVNIAKLLSEDEKLLDTALKLSRRSKRVNWARIEPKKFWSIFMQDNYISNMDTNLYKKIKIKLKDEILYANAFNLDDVEEILKKCFKLKDKDLTDNIRKFACAALINIFRSGSQIHQNNALLLYFGLPLVKLDCFYRGTASEEDILTICAQLQTDEADLLRTLLFSKSYGGDVLFGWKRALFNRGFI